MNCKNFVNEPCVFGGGGSIRITGGEVRLCCLELFLPIQAPIDEKNLIYLWYRYIKLMTIILS